MADKLYSNPPPYTSINNIYNGAPCAKQVFDQNPQFYPYNNSFNQPNNLLESFNIISPQNCHKPQNLYTYPTQDWDTQDTIKIPDKIEMIEISSKDLSPASYCSNLDFYMPDFYKNLGKDLNYYNTAAAGQWFSNNTNYSGNTVNSQKTVEYPSCAQINTQNSNLQVEKTVKYCSIQNIQQQQQQKNSQDFDYISSELTSFSQQNYVYNSTIYGGNCYNNSENKLPDTLTQSQFFDIPVGESFPQLDQQTEGSNEESDIIVEESDEEITEYDKKLPSEINKCIICNISYTPLGTQFYYLTLKSPLTMSSQKPVFTKIVNIIGNFTQKINYLCSDCLGLINTIDHLQLKLDNYNKELLTKFKKTCEINSVHDHAFNKTPPHSVHNHPFNKTLHRRRKFKIKDPQMKCRLCKKILSLKRFCQVHYFKKHKFRGFLCELCGEISSSRRKFKIHLDKHKFKPPKISSFKCTNCVKFFRTKSNLVEHENYCLGLLPFSCKFCDKKFQSSTKLKNHVKLKHDKKFIAICSICNIGFIKLSDYKSHKISHSTDKKFSCTKCDKTYKTLSNLNFHLKSHNGALPFICEVCDRGFMRKEYLEAHVNNHKGVKNFNCSICDKKFVSQKNLDSHLKYHEGTAKTRTCNVCGKVMTTGFEEHLRIHNNLMEFECDLCDCRFNTKGTLAKHKKRKHSVL